MLPVPRNSATQCDCTPLTLTHTLSLSQHELVFCYTILEANKRLMLLLAASIGTQPLPPTSNHLDSFFPFDPYFLHRYVYISCM